MDSILTPNKADLRCTVCVFRLDGHLHLAFSSQPQTVTWPPEGALSSRLEAVGFLPHLWLEQNEPLALVFFFF